MDPVDLTALAAVFGVLVGLAQATTGAGGGILAMPLLIVGLQLSVVQATPIALLGVGLSAGLGATLALRQGRLRYRAAGLIGLAGVLVAPLGTWLAHRLPATPLTLLFAAVLAYVAIRTFREAGKPLDEGSDPEKLPCVLDADRGRFQWTAPCARALIATGGLSGLLSGTFGVGGGFVIVPALARYTNLAQASVVGTSLGVIALVSAGSVGVAAASGLVLWPLALPFTLGSAAGMLLGGRLAGRLPAARLKQAFGVISLLAAAVMVVRVL